MIGCDIAWVLYNQITFASENPSVFTDAYCYLDWIAKQYEMSVPPSYTKPETCNESKGDINDLDQKYCKATRHEGVSVMKIGSLLTGAVS